jgi:hypothetical protein
MSRSALIAALLAVTLVAAGCGGDDEVSDEEFVAEVEEVCTAAEADLQAAVLSIIGVTNEQQAAEKFTDEILPLIDQLIADLEEITPPEDKAADYDRLLELTNESKDLIAEDPQAAFEAESGAGSSGLGQRIDEISAEANELSASLGIPAGCGSSGGSAGGSTGDTLGTDTGG